jgi:broad specificity phosphatase PhoE
MGKLLLVRHGESAGNRDRIFATDPHSLPLTELGYTQAEEVARLIGARFNAELVVSSPYVRARETARVIASALTLPLEIEPDLYEREVGAHRGQSYDSLASAPDYDASRPWAWRPNGGESYLDVESRVAPVLHRLAAQHPTGDVVVVSHGGVMMTLWAHISKRWDAAYIAPNCGVLLVEHGPEGYKDPLILDALEAASDAGG